MEKKYFHYKIGVSKPNRVSSDGPSGKFSVAFERALKSAQFIIVDTAYAVVAREALSAQKPV